MAISHWYTHLIVRNGNFTLLLTSSCQEWQFHIATDISGQEIISLELTSSDQEWQFHIATCTSSGQEWLFNISTDI